MTKILVIGIAGDPQIRNRFEDKLASHLTARGIGARASHSIVRSLSAIQDREEILAAIEKEGVDGAITVRAVGLDEIGEAGWVAAWVDGLATPVTIRQVIEQTLPIPVKKAKRYGIEVALWDIRPGQRLWAARSGTCTRKTLQQQGVGDLLERVIDALKDTIRP